MTWVIALVILVLLVASLRLWRTAVRLDRLHLRTQSAWAALDAALSRRAVAARAIAVAADIDPDLAVQLRAAARGVEGTTFAHRADAENDLTRALELLPLELDPGLADELADAAERVVLARRFYNDAVRDTRALRSALFTRIFRLAGRAALPDFFEIAEYVPVQPVARVSARVVLRDETGRVLLFHGIDPMNPLDRFWFTPGGGVDPGEELVDAAVRELAEETGLVLQSGELVGPIWMRRQRFSFNGADLESVEHYFFAPPLPSPDGAAPVISTAGFDELEQRSILGHRWWTPTELADTHETVYPRQLGARLVALPTVVTGPEHDEVGLIR